MAAGRKDFQCNGVQGGGADQGSGWGLKLATEILLLFTLCLIYQQIIPRFPRLRGFWKAKTVCFENRPKSQSPLLRC